MNDATPTKVGLLVVNRFPMLAFACTADPFESANWLSGKELFRLSVYAPGGAFVRSFNRLGVIPLSCFERADDLDVVFVCAGLNVESECGPAVLARLRQLAQRGCVLGAVSFGPYILARAGLLDGCRCAAHWELHRAMRENFPRVKVNNSVLEIDRARYTCAGGTSSIDLSLALIARQHGTKMAARIADQYIHDRVRNEREILHSTETLWTARESPKLQTAITLMERNIETPLSLETVAHAIGTSSRQLSRLFRTHVEISFSEYYTQLRLDQARYLVLNSSMPILSIALATGFVSHAHFTKRFRERFGCTPTSQRRGDG